MSMSPGSSGSSMAPAALDDAGIRGFSIDTIRGLAMDAVQKANAGHPGTAMALAPLGYTLFQRFLRVNPSDTAWAGPRPLRAQLGPRVHAAVLAAAPVRLRPRRSRTCSSSASGARARPGTPSAGTRPASRSRPGRSGRASPTRSGMAIAERFLADRFNRPGSEIVDHHVYVICSDGDMMEGISQEAASIAGHFALGKLIVCYDDNHITIDGTTSISFDGENHTARMEADGWHVQRVEDSEDLDALEAAIAAGARGNRAPVVHRDPLAHRLPGAARGRHRQVARRAARRGGGAGDQGGDGLRPGAPLLGRRARVRAHVAARARRGRAGASGRSASTHGARPSRRWPATGIWRGRARLRDGWREALPTFAAGEQIATRSAGQKAMAAFGEYAPTMIGGAADLVESTKTRVRRRRRVLRGARRAQRPVRHPRARDGRDRQRRRRARRDRQALRLDVPDVLRLHARLRCACRR